MPTKPTIARIWRGRTRRDVADRYEPYIRAEGIPPLERTALGVAIGLLCALLCGCAASTDHVALEAARRAPDPADAHASVSSVLVPPVEIVGSEALFNVLGRRFWNADGAYDVTRESIRRNAGSAWLVDDDPFQINQAGHPYQGALYHAFGRSAGLGFWPSATYTFLGSVLWEIAGETTPPSVNDQIASGVAGTFLGEAMFRTANLLIDKANNRPGVGRMLLVLFVSPPTAINRTLFGETFDHVVKTHDPLYDVRLQLGSIGGLHRKPGASFLKRDETMLTFSIEYGLPGQSGYRYSRPFDYYELRATASSANGLEELLAHGLIAGRDYRGRAARGIWGLYGTYDYIAPQVFRVSTTAMSFGTNGRVSIGDRAAVRFGGAAGLGYSAAQALADKNDRDYHYGVTPLATASVGLLLGSRVALDARMREYWISNVGGLTLTPRIDDTVARGEMSLGVRVFHRSAISVRYLISTRDTINPQTGHQSTRRETVGLFFTLLGPQQCGAVDGPK